MKLNDAQKQLQDLRSYCQGDSVMPAHGADTLLVGQDAHDTEDTMTTTTPTITPTMIAHLRLMADRRVPLPSQFRRFAGDNLQTLRATLDAMDAGEAVPDEDLLAYLEDWSE